VPGDAVHERVKLADHLHGDEIHGAAGKVEGQDRNVVVGLEPDGAGHGRSPQTRSMMVAVPMPPPMQSVTSAVPLPVRSSSSSAVPSSMAPVAPRGCPMAIAPPLTLTTS